MKFDDAMELYAPNIVSIDAGAQPASPGHRRGAEEGGVVESESRDAQCRSGLASASRKTWALESVGLGGASLFSDWSGVALPSIQEAPGQVMRITTRPN